jgi:hypothetical protein
MRTALRAILLACLAACGGGGATTKPPVDPNDGEPRGTRRIIEDSTQEDDDGGDDGMEVTSTRGRMEVADIEAGIAPHAGALETCFTDKIGRRKWLGGKVSITWTISKAGEITGVTVPESDLGAWEVEKCLVEIARAATFAKPKGGGTDFSLPFEFTAKGTSVWWEEDVGYKAVGKRIDELAKCSATGQPAPGGEVMITLYVGTRGKVQTAGFASAKAIPVEWGDCALKVLEGWTLADPRGKVAKVGLRYRAP